MGNVLQEKYSALFSKLLFSMQYVFEGGKYGKDLNTEYKLIISIIVLPLELAQSSFLLEYKARSSLSSKAVPLHLTDSTHCVPVTMT